MPKDHIFMNKEMFLSFVKTLQVWLQPYLHGTSLTWELHDLEISPPLAKSVFYSNLLASSPGYDATLICHTLSRYPSHHRSRFLSSNWFDIAFSANWTPSCAPKMLSKHWCITVNAAFIVLNWWRGRNKVWRKQKT